MSLNNIEAGSMGRDRDLALASDVSRVFETNEGDFFVLTGSYAIEAVAKNPNIVHNDVDVNIFTADKTRSLAGASHRLSLLNMDLVKSTESRLEYVRGGSLIELQFVQYDRAQQTQSGVDFKLPTNDSCEAVVPTIVEALQGTDAEAYMFRVKTLSYAIATWALRISGFAEAQKRSVRQSDINHFALLLQSSYDKDKVIEAILHHPQTPAHRIGHADDVLDAALEVVSKNEVKDE